MQQGHYVFSQVMAHLPLTTFRRCVARYRGEHKIKRFSCLDQYLCLAFAFFGTSENAVKSQIWIAVSVYVLVAIVKKRLALTASLYEILQILSLTLFEKTPVNGLFDSGRSHNILEQRPNQLNLFN
jgi:hypothetical protein